LCSVLQYTDIPAYFDTPSIKLKYTIESVNKILIPETRTIFCGEAEGSISGLGGPESCQHP
jgi:hypothetical protein